MACFNTLWKGENTQTRSNMLKKAFTAAFPYTIPIFAGFPDIARNKVLQRLPEYRAVFINTALRLCTAVFLYPPSQDMDL